MSKAHKAKTAKKKESEELLFTNGEVNWLNDWLIEWLNDWLIEWLTDWMTDWMIDLPKIVKQQFVEMLWHVDFFENQEELFQEESAFSFAFSVADQQADADVSVPKKNLFS